MSSKKTYKPCAVYDFRYSKDEKTPTDIISLLKGIAKKYVFQLEKGDSGYLHYQGRLSLIKKRRKNEALKLFVTPPLFFEPTCNPEYCKGTAFYQMKTDTRVEGPFQDTDEVIYIPRQIREISCLRPFQQRIVDMAGVWDTRTINLVFCPEGNKGKSILVGYCRAYKIARALPPVNDSRDLMRMVCDLPTSRCYLFDMPRAQNKDRLYQFYSAVETIKDGYAWDDRYSFKEKIFDSPNIYIFTNTLPNLNMLSLDRWKIWSIDENYELVNFQQTPVFGP